VRDTTLYQHLLGLKEPWTVARVDLDVTAQRVDVWVEHPSGLQWPCPECGALGALHDHAAERVWRHLDSCQFQTLLHAEPPRMKCSEHEVRQVRLPWAEPHARFTVLFEAFAIQVLRETSIQAARKILGITWDEAWYLMHRAVARGLARKRPFRKLSGSIKGKNDLAHRPLKTRRNSRSFPAPLRLRARTRLLLAP
jgi:transposase